MTKQMIYLIGGPGAGKTSLMGAVLADQEIQEVRRKPFAHVVYKSGLVQLGDFRPPFSGTDTLSMGVLPKAIAFLAAPGGPETVVAEGDRLSTGKFFAAMRAAGYRLTVALLQTPEALAAERRAQRGSEQNPSWVRGRATKVSHLAAEWADPRWVLDGTLSVTELAGVLRQHPALTCG